MALPLTGRTKRKARRMTVTDYPDYTTPQAHANAISLTGAPPLVLKQVLDFLVGQNMNGGTSLTRPASGSFSVNQPGYEIFLNVATLGTPAPVLSVELQWYDSFTGSLVDDEAYLFYSGNVNGHFVHGRGPSKGDRLVVVLKNTAASTAMSVSYVLMQTSRTFTREFWKTISKAGTQPVYPGLNAGLADISSNMFYNQSSTVAANGTNSFVLPLYTGTVRLSGITTDTTAGRSKWIVVNLADPAGFGSNLVQASNGQSGFAYDGVSSLWLPELPLPRAQCQLQLLNTDGTASHNLITSIIPLEDRA